MYLHLIYLKRNFKKNIYNILFCFNCDRIFLIYVKVILIIKVCKYALHVKNFYSQFFTQAVCVFNTYHKLD